MKITATTLWYYFTCDRELWFFANGINMDYDNEYVRIGRELDNSKNKRELEGGKFDLIKTRKGKIIVEETKKSNKLKDMYVWQVKYYLYLLRKRGIKADGEIIYRENKEKEDVILKEEDVTKIEKAIEEIPRIVKKERPPKAVKKPYCKNCAYYYLCWIDEDEG